MNLFNGYCNHCWSWGHKRQDCRKLTAERKGGGKDSKGGKDPKGKGKDKGGSWRTKGYGKGGCGGGKSYGKDYGGKGGKGPGAVAYNIDGDQGGYDGGWGHNDNSWFSFMLAGDVYLNDDKDENMIFGLEDTVLVPEVPVALTMKDLCEKRKTDLDAEIERHKIMMDHNNEKLLATTLTYFTPTRSSKNVVQYHFHQAL